MRRGRGASAVRRAVSAPKEGAGPKALVVVVVVVVASSDAWRSPMRSVGAGRGSWRLLDMVVVMWCEICDVSYRCNTLYILMYREVGMCAVCDGEGK